MSLQTQLWEDRDRYALSLLASQPSLAGKHQAVKEHLKKQDGRLLRSNIRSWC